ncbi:hypothetical protein PR202_gb25832 [Eleusine coracana subsp. coracana]|uniref:Uncharacterized protein n=1 Tax=Eleusine coracana subsp. coracana TaxID=191504 RepID=A0AAV5FQY2_ELECO|nr:hypothetical protein PR202_gb25796 [Eleusine coracana subsp. coracana]GJN36928.1 hypothetical protein PR202_gb25832 [Eleusine coracana subsp. coracana]
MPRSGYPKTLEVREMELDDELMAALCGYNMLRVSSWDGIGLDCVDFGGGRPARVHGGQRGETQRASLLPVPPVQPCSRTDHDGANVAAFCVTEEHVDKFLAELTRLQLISVPSPEFAKPKSPPPGSDTLADEDPPSGFPLDEFLDADRPRTTAKLVDRTPASLSLGTVAWTSPELPLPPRVVAGHLR